MTDNACFLQAYTFRHIFKGVFFFYPSKDTNLYPVFSLILYKGCLARLTLRYTFQLYFASKYFTFVVNPLDVSYIGLISTSVLFQSFQMCFMLVVATKPRWLSGHFFFSPFKYRRVKSAGVLLLICECVGEPHKESVCTWKHPNYLQGLALIRGVQRLCGKIIEDYHTSCNVYIYTHTHTHR